MPLEQPAMMLIVPVGAMVVTVALRTRAPAGRVEDGALEVGEDAALARRGPRSSARASSWMKLMTSPAMRQASSES